MAVTLEDYRIQVIEQLRVAHGTARARDLLAVSFDASDCALACYSAAGFSADLRSAAGPGLILVSSGDLYG